MHFEFLTIYFMNKKYIHFSVTYVIILVQFQITEKQ